MALSVHAPAFEETKATQVAARLLQRAGGRLNYMKLIKLLYLVDRVALDQRGLAVTNATYCSMKFGPALGEVLDLVTEPEWPAPGQTAGFWHQHISEPVNFEVSLKSDPGNGKLSEAEEEYIAEVFEQFGNYSALELMQSLRKALPEWKEVSGGRVLLPVADILKALGKTDDEIREVEGLTASTNLVQSLFAAG